MTSILYKEFVQKCHNVSRVIQSKSMNGSIGATSYATFLFWYQAGELGSAVNFEPDEFGELCIEGLITEVENDMHTIDLKHPLNIVLISLLDVLQNDITNYLKANNKPKSDKFDWSLKDSYFWYFYLGFDLRL